MFGIFDLRKKLDVISGTIYTIEGIVKIVSSRVKKLSELVEQTHTKVNSIFDLLTKEAEEPDHSSFFFSKIQIDNIVIEGRIEKITMNEFQQVSATYKAEKKDGSPARVQNPRIETDRPDVLTGELDEANSKVTFKAISGVVQEDTAVAVKVVADADLGEGVKEIEVVGSVLVTPGQAEKLTLEFDDPVDQ